MDMEDFMNNVVIKIIQWCLAYIHHKLYYDIIPKIVDTYPFNPLMECEWVAADSVVNGELTDAMDHNSADDCQTTDNVNYARP